MLYNISDILLMIPSNQKISLFVFFSTLASYNFIRIPILFFQNEKLPAKKRIMLESKLVKFLGRKDKLLTEMKHLDNLEYKTFVNKFNDAYERTLRTEQKNLLTNYIIS